MADEQQEERVGLTSADTQLSNVTCFRVQKKKQAACMRKRSKTGSGVCLCRAAEKRHADGTFTSDVSSYLKEQAIKDFVAKLKSGQARRE